MFQFAVVAFHQIRQAALYAVGVTARLLSSEEIRPYLPSMLI
jgi:hypothetical protein